MHNVAGTVVFTDSTGTLKLEAPGSYTGAIAGFQKGDKIDLPGQTVTTLEPHITVGSTTIDVLNGSTTIAALNLLGNYTGYVFDHATDGAGGTNLTVACYAADARILTARGEVAAGSLREGDLVATASGALKPVRWIGRSGIALGEHPQPESAAPIRIRASAFAPGLPHRDLLVSPDHGVLAAEALIPARYLVNGSTIVREPATGVADYVHIEIDRHDMLLAEGLAAESYLDTGNRAAFAPHARIRRRV